jgi:hypothetical protein
MSGCVSETVQAVHVQAVHVQAVHVQAVHVQAVHGMGVLSRLTMYTVVRKPVTQSRMGSQLN